MKRYVSESIAVLVLGAMLSLFSAANAAATCVGDCDMSGGVGVNEIVKCVNVYLGTADLSTCTECDQNGDQLVMINEIVSAVNSYLNPDACPMLTAPPTPTPTIMAKCGNGIVEAGEECDNGSVCFGGTNDGADCTSDPSVCDGATCGPAGGQGCAVNCTSETVTVFEYTGAVCRGGAKDGTGCNFEGFCNTVGALNGKPCGADSDCGAGSCVSECGADSKGCFGDGECVAGSQPAGSQCYVTSSGDAVGSCVGSGNAGADCISNLDCPGGTCANPCGDGGICRNRSRSTLGSLTTEIPIGPLVGHQTFHYGKAESDGLVPVAIPATGTVFAPVKVPGVVCACVRGIPNPEVHGPGNSGSGMVNCGAGTIANTVTLSVDHNTNTPGTCVRGTNAGMACTANVQCGATVSTKSCNIGSGASSSSSANGPGTCSGGTVEGRACANNANCLGGGTCMGLGGGGGVCMGPPKFCVGGSKNGAACFNDAECPDGGSCPGTGNYLRACKTNGDCPGSLCDSPDDPNCTAQDPLPPDGSGAKSCLVEQIVCTVGSKIGEPCTSNTDCGTGGTCATECAATAPSNTTGYCISPNHLTLTGAGGQGEALFLTTTAIGTIFSDGGACKLAAKCAGGTSSGSPCIIDADCAGGGKCATATCSNDPTKSCASDSACGAGNTCVPVDAAKGLDGRPCTDDDPVGSRGQAQTIPTTTGISSTMIVDTNLNPGSMMAHHNCSSGTGANCNAALHGSPVDCSQLTAANPSFKGVRLGSTFPALDQQIGDSVVTTFLTAK